MGVETVAESSEDTPDSEQGGVGEVDSEVGSSSSELEESESGAGQEVAAGVRKPSKKALENAMNEVMTISGVC